ncbi:MAG: malonyl-CoA synthase [Rhodospirillaceae bacterium]|nr:malonyl-CoA synthase [Rhodospirillaceae bacterium]
MSEGLFHLLRSRFPTDLSKPFLILPNSTVMSYGDIDVLSACMANALAASGAKPGDRVAVQVNKSAEAVALYLACLRGGFVYLPLNSAYREDELEYFLTDAEPTVAVGDETARQFKGIAENCAVKSFFTLAGDGGGSLMAAAQAVGQTQLPADRNGDDLGAILYSSGTTGKPKGVMLSHGNLASNALTLHRLWQFSPNDILLHALPIFHTHGLFVALNTTLLNGTPILFHAAFSSDDVIADLPRATVLMGVPTYYVRLLASPKFNRDVCKNMRLFISGSAPLLEETFTSFVERTGHLILERYGMTEAGMITSAHPDKPRRANTVGWPLPDVSLRIVGENSREQMAGATGEIQIKGPSVFSGYWRKPEKTAEDFTADGYFKTGDIARLEPDGMVTIVGRAKDMMISGGFNVYPKEIEALIDALPGVDESAVVGMPHPDFGEAGLAIVTMKSGKPALSCDDVIAALKGKLANYKVPKLVVVADALPRNAMGKVQKNELQKTYLAAWHTGIKNQAR